jgi:hypothetical protein
MKNFGEGQAGEGERKRRSEAAQKEDKNNKTRWPFSR